LQDSKVVYLSYNHDGTPLKVTGRLIYPGVDVIPDLVTIPEDQFSKWSQP
jgi:hypothetical protein